MTMGMRIAAGLGLSIIAATGAQAAPKVAGTYGMISSHVCQTVFQAPKGTADKNNVANAQPVIASFGPLWSAGSNAAGMISVTVGTVTFPDTPSTSGNASFNNVEMVGHAQRFASTGVAADNSGFMRKTNMGDGAFTITSTMATLNGKNYDYSYGNVVAGVAHTINLVRRPVANEYCLDSMTLTKQ
jgi:hypothetical protein